jgi:hypothetical protein
MFFEHEGAILLVSFSRGESLFGESISNRVKGIIDVFRIVRGGLKEI